MSGKQTFRGRRHESREGMASHTLTSSEIGALRFSLEEFLGRVIYADDFGDLVEAVAVARLLRLEQEKCGHTKPLEARHRIATLAGLGKISDDRALIVGLLCCDIWSFEAIRFAWLDAMPGQFGWDVPDLEFHARSLLADERHAFLGGIDSLRRAIAVAHSQMTEPSGAARTDSGGRPSKDHYQIPLAKQCVRLWNRYGPPGEKRFWCEPAGGLRSDGVRLAEIVFAVAGMVCSADRLVSLLKKSASAG